MLALSPFEEFMVSPILYICISEGVSIGNIRIKDSYMVCLP